MFYAYRGCCVSVADNDDDVVAVIDDVVLVVVDDAVRYCSVHQLQ